MAKYPPRKPIIIETTSTLTSRYQTTIPSEVRKALGLEKGDTLFYQVGADGVRLITEEMKRRLEADFESRRTGIEYDPPSRELFLAADSGDETYEVVGREEYDEGLAEMEDYNGEDPAVLALLDYLERDIKENPENLIPISKLFSEVRNDLVKQHGEKLREMGMEYLLQEDLSDEDLTLYFAEMVDEVDDPENPTDWSQYIDHDLSQDEIDAINSPLGKRLQERSKRNKKRDQ